MRLFERSLIAVVIAGALICAAPLTVKPLAAQQSEAKKKIKKAGKDVKDAGKKGSAAAADAGKAAGKTVGDDAKAGASNVKEIATDTAPKGVTAQCDDGTWTKTTKRTGACVTHGGVASVVCPGALCKQ